MSTWLLGIVGVVFMGVIVDVVLPTGKTKNIIRCVFAIFTIYIIISPLPKFLSKGVEFKKETSIVLDENFLFTTNSQLISAYEKGIENKAKEQGFNGIGVVIWADLSESEIAIQKVFIDLTNVVLPANIENINKYEVLKSIVREYVSVDEEDITFYE